MEDIMNKKDIASIYKVLILYENLNNEDITIDSYLNYIDRLYVYWVGVGDKEIYEILKGLWILGANAGHKRVKSMVFHMIDVIEKRG
jgi:hypothetical protein